ncbi:molecular chaperone DnaJ [Candidatus Uhrbacteria bacterium RIFOXYB12_FULL_58_10]|uniref:Chaperone protein DnaJ n=1 Tax=Candidatus Uhrbacteria bacterium RIFOXYB2_FULL_57_15 TaxID=1802422 RepID=A0A1F7W6Q6_9BACT|nr:MAG: molecular chaperone DnaJ [Candidatus Uhrbacteria bacterium RIFOXYB12_FULL_58_10]OGL98450.1 MAG: molecular chaperone DnaJ [Candidatus Uhrbacteria bacterium RIFOXYB2_FULL_57_15]OGL99235.1 MAG: molecular chaperone DnaJ [Candidatus Uhrbacteria bacterium RIFOXYC12_FULL_57_11]
MAKDYYNVLGVNKSASQDEIKAAFRRLAHQYHPDKPTGNEAKFKEINEAYQVVGDSEKRAKYDRFGSAAFDGNGGGGQGFGGFDFSGFGGQGGGFEDLGDLFGGMFGFGGGRGPREPRGSDIQVDVELTFRDSVFGADKEISLSKFDTCERCDGVGAEPGTKLNNCSDCGGKGVKIVSQRTVLGTFQTKAPCHACEGEGKIPEKRCTACHGDGVTRGKKTLSVHVPSGVENGNVLRVRGAGEAVRGGKPGDLFVRLHIKNDTRFAREGSTIYSTLRIGFTQAALGASVETETVDGPTTVIIEAGTQGGTEIRVRGKGVVTGTHRGDHVFVVEVATPTKLSREQRKLLEELDLKE